MNKFVRQHLQQALDIRQGALDQGRDLTEEEVTQIKGLVDKARAERLMGNRVEDFLGGDGESFEIRQEGTMPSGRLGDTFIQSEGYKKIANAANRGQSWSSGPVEVGYQVKGTLFEGSVAGTMVPADYRPGVVSKLFQPVGLASYFGQEQTTSSHVRYVIEGTATSGAAGVAEGAAKPESTLNYAEVDEPVKKIATSVPVSDELLEDAVAVQSYLNTRPSLFVTQEEERQLLLGTGTNELVGITGRSGINTLGTAAGGTIPIELVFKAAAGSRGSAFVDPDLLVINPSNWQTLRLAKDSAGQYFGGGPWQGAYGQQSQVSTGQFSSSPLWGMNVWVTNALGTGTAILGSFKQAAAIFRRGGVTVEASNSHQDYFVKNLNQIRAEERLALAVYRPASFVVITF
jgi:HK97 family phage major capsid protein